MATTSPTSDAAQLQEVLTRYVDSRDGYLQASKLVPQEALARNFASIAERRDLIAAKMANLIEDQGFRPDEDGSPEASVHRWWLRVRDKMTDQEADAILAECVRGETELVRTLNAALDKPELLPEHRQLIEDMIAEVTLAVRAFDSAIGDLEPERPSA
ncbi:PA2169 family four-helix-bundle protein [Luteolibacter luteus]|uniref:PA2169 family four-helix-bundle protein n=1 Tax=Luteolibacter luteus TaxID=2728835 RepID=A0A858RJB2_9BACT|nr:PA2169 family four-helix-bundle protein [Luteolibacter luteus]QJE96300.1 PA2169 family four-helix-bundle protein [Luteolibacter luteus]